MKTMHLYGLGPTVEHAPLRPEFCIGVNDAAARFRFLRDIVIVDKMSAFANDRLTNITHETPTGTHIYSNIKEWGYIFKNFTQLHFAKARGDVSTLNDPHVVPQSLCSPFVAACVAWSHLQARVVVMHGVDITTHAVLSKASAKIFEHFGKLNEAFRKNGGQLYVGSKHSPLSEIIPVYYGKD